MMSWEDTINRLKRQNAAYTSTKSTGTVTSSKPITTTSTAKSSYQQNVAQPVQTQKPITTRNTLGDILKVTQSDKTKGVKLQNDFQTLQQDPTSTFYAPYTKATNKAVSNLSSMGIDTSKIDDDWFEQTKWLDDYLVYNGTTNTPSSPGKKATAEQSAAYERYQIQKQRDMTSKAKTEWDALQEEVSFLTKWGDRNYSDDEIVDYVYSHDFAKKYPTLSKMDESLSGNGTALLELNEGVDYCRDNLYGVIWAARNGGGTGNVWQNTAWSALGEGNTWRENKEVADRLNPMSDHYAPYTIGSTMDDACMYFNRTSFDSDWLMNNKPDATDKTSVDMWNKVYDAEQFTQKAEEEASKFNQWLDKKLNNAKDPSEVMRIVDSRLEDEYSALSKMKTSQEKVDSLLDTTRSIDFSYNDVRNKVYAACERNGWKPDEYQTLEKNGVQIGTQQDKETAKTESRKVYEANSILEGSATQSEQNVFENTPSTIFDLAINGFISAATDPFSLISKNETSTASSYSNQMIALGADLSANQAAQTKLDNLNALNDEYVGKIEQIQDAMKGDSIGMPKFISDLMDGEYIEVSEGSYKPNSNYASALLELYEYVTGLPSVGEDGGIRPEAMDSARVLWECAQTWQPTYEEGEELPWVLPEFSEDKKNLESEVERTAYAQKEYDNQQSMWDARIELYDRAGLDSTGLRTAQTVAQYMQNFAEYEPTQWDAYSLYDTVGKALGPNATYDQIIAATAEDTETYQLQLQNMKDLKNYLEENNVAVPENYMTNLDRYIGKLERTVADYEYFTIRGRDDYEERAAKGEEKGKSFLETTFFGGDKNPLNEIMTEDEKKTFYYLLDEDPMEAQEYYNHLTDESYGVLHTRLDEETQKQAQAEVDSGFWGGAWANLKAIASAPFDSLATGAYMLNAAISGDEFNPHNTALSLGKYAKYVNAATMESIRDTLGEDTFLGQIASGAYEILYNRGRSMANSYFFSFLGNMTDVAMINEFAGAVPMATEAMGMAIADAKEKNIDDANAFLYGGITFLAESLSESITYGNIKEAIQGSDEEVSRGVKDLLINWIKKSGFEEAIGETATEKIEQMADKEILGAFSDHANLVKSYIEKLGLDPDNPADYALAEEYASRDEVGSLVHTALISYMSPGLDVVAGAGTDFLRDLQNVRLLVREQHQNGNTDANMANMWGTYKEWKQNSLMSSAEQQQETPQDQQETSQEQQETPQEQQPQEQQVQQLQEQEVSAETQQVEQPAVNEEQTANPEAVTQETTAPKKELSEADQAFLRDLGALDAVEGSDSSTQAAALGSLFGAVENTNEGDVAKAAAAAIPNLFGGTMADAISNMKNLLIGSHVSFTDAETVKQAIKTAALAPNSSAATVVSSAEFQNASPVDQASMLASTVETDQQDASVAEQVAQSTHEYRVAEAEKTLIANGALDSVKVAQEAADKAKENLRMANESLSEKQATKDAKAEVVRIATQELQQNPTNDNQHALDRALNELTAADAVEQEYGQHLEAIQRANDDAQTKLSDAKETAMRDLRNNAEAAVAQVDEQRMQIAEQAAQQAQEEAQAQAKAKAEEDERTGKAWEDTRDIVIDQILDNEYLEEGERRDQRRAELVERANAIKAGNINMAGMMSNAEGLLAVGMLGRNLGAEVKLTNDTAILPDGAAGKYENGIIYLNGNMIQSGKMTVGQAVMEVALHEFTHAMENTKQYAKYSQTVMDFLFRGDTARMQAAIDSKIADYKEQFGQNLTEDGARAEIVADFAKNRLNERDVVQRFIDNGLAGKIRNALHNINQAIKNFRLTGTERETAEYLRKTERLYQKMIEEAARTATHPDGNQFSIAQLADATGLEFNENTLELRTPEGAVVDGVNNKITPEMLNNTPVGMLIDLAESRFQNKKGKTTLAPTISTETAQAQRQMFADLANMAAQYRDSNLVWEIASSTLFSAMKSNSDPQYSTTVDFGTICAKTQEIINVMSQVMLEKGRGLTREEVLKVYNETANAGLTVPCPVCYVFSRWMGVPSLLGQMSQYQKRFVKTNDDGSINVAETQKAANDYIKSALEKYGDKKGINDAKTSLLNRIKTQENNRTDALKVIMSETATEAEKAAAKEKHNSAIDTMDSLTEELGEIEAFNWVTQALCKQQRNGRTVTNVLDADGNYVIDSDFELTRDDVLFDLRRTGDFAKSTKNWSYRNTRGAGMGKAIMPYSGESIGDIIYGTSRKMATANPFLTQDPQTAAKGIKDAITRAVKQNLIGGQRLQSTSDFRPEWGLDYMMSFLELQAIGSKVQMYTKVAEAVPLLASMGADINLSIMGKGKGWHVDENGTYTLDFSDVTGMNYETAKGLKNQYSNVQMILVGMNDTHIRLALADSDIDFVIPWHASGNSKDTLSSLVSSASIGQEQLETSSDYTDTQSDKASENQTAEQKQLWNLRMKILQGKKINAQEREIIYTDEYLAPLYRRFNVEGEDADCYKVKLGQDQAKQIFPYEYWDKTLTKDQADENGKRFVEYCQHFGITPRFSGTVKHNEDGTFDVTGNFAGAVYDENGNITGYDPEKMDTGYWKVLIDRPMYDNEGNYRDQQVVDVTKAKIGRIEDGKLVDSDMPLTTSAMYGPGYSEQEKNAVDNSLAAINEQEDLRGVRYSDGGVSLTDLEVQQNDQNYQDAVDSGDTETAQKLVDNAANEAGYSLAVFHGTGDEFNEFERGREGIHLGDYSQASQVASTKQILFGKQNGNVKKLYAKISNPFTLNGDIGTWTPQNIAQVLLDRNAGEDKFGYYGDYVDISGSDINLTEEQVDALLDLSNKDEMEVEDEYWDVIADVLEQNGYDGIRYLNTYEGDQNSFSYIALRPSDVKSADPVTYDDNGNVIPLSERFNTSNPDIRYSDGGTSLTELDQQLVGSGIISQEELDAYNGVPGIPKNLPDATAGEGGTAQRQFGSQTAQGSNALHDDVKAYLYSHSSYTPDSNQEQIDRSISWVQSHANESDPDGFFGAMQEAQSGNFYAISADGQARMLTLMSMAALKGEQTGDHSAELVLADMFNKQGTEAGRALQARKIFRLMTPVGRVATLNRMADQINEEYGRKGRKTRVGLSDFTLQAAAVAETEEDFQKVQNAAAKELAQQMPASWKEKFTAWRMLSMLGNPRTHVRNLVGNALFMPAVGLKNKIGATLETAFVDSGDRTKTLGIASKDARAFAKADANEMESVLRGENKYSEGTQVQQERKMFGQGNGIVSRTGGRILQGLIDLNGNALEAEDWIFLKRHYQNAMAGYMTANKLTEADMKGETLDKARAYAVQEAQKATYRDANEIATWMNSIKNPAAKFVVNAVLPFKKTPANILKRGVEYSPAGLIRSLTTDARHLQQWNAYQNGELSAMPEKAISPAQYIDRLSAGLSGTLIMAAGALLSGLGFVRAGLDDDDDEFDKLKGSQEYSIEIGGVSFTADWAAPMSMPFFVGATIMDEIRKGQKGEDLSLGDVLDAMIGISEPVFNLSMLDGVNSLLNTNQYSDGNNITQIGEKVVTNYFTSYVPTILGQAARTIDTTRRKNFVESGADLPVFRNALEQIENKLPFLSQTNIPYRNVWGEADVSSTGWAAIENFLSPGYGNTITDDPVVNELQRIYEETGDKNMIPKAASKTVAIGGETIRLNAEQYDQYVVDRGQTAKQCLTDLMESPVWQICDDSTRAMMVSDAWTYANQIARHQLDKNGKLDTWVANAQHNGNFVETVTDRAAESNRKDYISGYGQTMAEALDYNDGEMYELSVAALDGAGATEAEIRAPLRDYFKPLYQQAFEAGDENTMEEIEEKLLDADVGFKSKDFDGWIPKEVDEDEEKPDNTRWMTNSLRSDMDNSMKPIYQAAMSSGDTAKMEQIEQMLLNSGLGYTEKDFEAWKQPSEQNTPGNSSSRFNPNSLMASAGISDVGSRARSAMPQRPDSENGWNQYMTDLDDYWAEYDFDRNDPTGRYGKGNIDLNNRIVVNNPDGSISTDLSFSFYDEDVGKEVLIPQVVNGRIVSEEEAKDHYYETGENFGMFDTWQDADEYAMMLHNRNNWYYRR